MEVRVIVNPHAGAGRGAARASEVMRLLETSGASARLTHTKHSGHATELARDAMMDGVSSLLIVGGDGSLNEVSQAFLDQDGQPVAGPELGIIPVGTGNDFSRSLELPSSPAAGVQRFMTSKPRPVDLGVVEVKGDQGQPIRRAFLNIASCGISGLVANMTNRRGKWMGGKLAFYLAAIRATLAHANLPVQLSVDGQCVHQGKVRTIAFANGRYFGGGMKVAPNAELDNGQLDCVVVGNVRKLEAVTNLPLIYKGTHLEHHQVYPFLGKTFKVEPCQSEPEVFVEADGEAVGRLPMTVRVHRQALFFRA